MGYTLTLCLYEVLAHTLFRSTLVWAAGNLGGVVPVDEEPIAETSASTSRSPSSGGQTRNPNESKEAATTKAPPVPPGGGAPGPTPGGSEVVTWPKRYSNLVNEEIGLSGLGLAFSLPEISPATMHKPFEFAVQKVNFKKHTDPGQLKRMFTSIFYPPPGGGGVCCPAILHVVSFSGDHLSDAGAYIRSRFLLQVS